MGQAKVVQDQRPVRASGAAGGSTRDISGPYPAESMDGSRCFTTDPRIRQEAPDIGAGRVRPARDRRSRYPPRSDAETRTNRDADHTVSDSHTVSFSLGIHEPVPDTDTGLRWVRPGCGRRGGGTVASDL